MSVLTGIRLLAGVTQKDVAQKLGVTNATVSGWERGVSKPPIGKVPAMAEIYNLPPNIMFDILVGKKPTVTVFIEPDNKQRQTE